MVAFGFESGHDVFDVWHRPAFLDPKFPAGMGGTLHFSKGELLSSMLVDGLGGGKLSCPLFNFDEQ